MIKEFRGPYRFCSNFFTTKQRLVYGEMYDKIIIDYNSNEHFFQANKAKGWVQHRAIANAPTPAIARSMGSRKGYTMPDGTLFKVDLKDNWDELRDPIMTIGVDAKFDQNVTIAKLLVSTYPEELQEGNWWGDDYWEVSFKTKKGLNKLGKITMNKRDMLIQKIQSQQ